MLTWIERIDVVCELVVLGTTGETPHDPLARASLEAMVQLDIERLQAQRHRVLQKQQLGNGAGRPRAGEQS